MKALKRWFIGDAIDYKMTLMYNISMLYILLLSVSFLLLIQIASPPQILTSAIGLIGGLVALVLLKVTKSAKLASLGYVLLGLTSNFMSVLTYANGELEIMIFPWFFVHVLVAFFIVGRLEGLLTIIMVLMGSFALLHFRHNDALIPYLGKIERNSIDRISSLVMVFTFMYLLLDAYLNHMAIYHNRLLDVLEKETNARQKLDKINTEIGLLQEVFNHIPEHVQVVTEKGDFLYANNATLDMLGIEASQLKTRSVFDLMHMFSRGENHQLWDRVFQDAKQNKITFRTRTFNFPTGEKREMEISFQHIAFESIECLFTMLRDVTERNELIKEKASFEFKQRLKDEFLANMSHEIRTPMNIIVGLSNLMEKSSQGLNAKLVGYVSMIKLNARNLLDIINDILDFSKIEAGKVNLEFKKFDLKLLVNEIHDMMLLPVETKGINYIQVFDPAIPSIMLGDTLRLRQILTNLMSNAIKFTSKGSVGVEVKLIKHTSNAVSIKFIVSDTGIGISTSNAQKILEPFTQAEISTTREYGGTGLGLSIVTNLLALYKSQLHIDSTPGEGSRFSFEIEFPVEH